MLRQFDDDWKAVNEQQWEARARQEQQDKQKAEKMRHLTAEEQHRQHEERQRQQQQAKQAALAAGRQLIAEERTYLQQVKAKQDAKKQDELQKLLQEQKEAAEMKRQKEAEQEARVREQEQFAAKWLQIKAKQDELRVANEKKYLK